MAWDSATWALQTLANIKDLGPNDESSWKTLESFTNPSGSNKKYVFKGTVGLSFNIASYPYGISGISGGQTWYENEFLGGVYKNLFLRIQLVDSLGNIYSEDTRRIGDLWNAGVINNIDYSLDGTATVDATTALKDTESYFEDTSKSGTYDGRFSVSYNFSSNNLILDEGQSLSIRYKVSSNSNYTKGNHILIRTSISRTLHIPTEISTAHTVTLNKGKGISSVYGSGTYTSGSSVTISATPSTGYHFKDWTNTSDNSYVWNANPYTFNVSGNLNLTANAEANTYTVNYIGHNATAGSMQPSNHVYDVPKNLSSNLYKKEHTITFNYNYTNGPIEEKTVASTFAGWAENAWSSGIYSDNQVVSNLTSENNGTVDLFTTWTLGSIQLPKPTRTGYTFKSWNTAINGGGIGVGGDYYEPNTDVTLYAQWEPIVYSIEYDYAGGTVETENPTTYTIESGIITLNSPTKVGYTFIGWTGSNGDTPQIDITINKGSTGNKSYTANWELDFYAYIKQPDGSWKQAEVYIKQNGTWKNCEIYVKDNNEWLKSVHKDL